MNLENILSMFGTEEARDRFFGLCREYYGERVRQEAAEDAGLAVPDSKRAEVHTEIMKIIQKLFLKKKDPMPSRKEVGRMIMEHFRRSGITSQNPEKPPGPAV